MSVYFFFGQEEFNIEQEIQEIKEKYLDENFSSLNLRRFSSPNYKELSNILRTTGTMFGNIINIINCERYFFKTGKLEIINFSETELKSLEEDLKLTSENVHTIFVLKLPRDEKKSIKTKEIYKILSKNAKTQEFNEFREYDKNLFNWIVKQAKSKNLTISTDNAMFLVEKAGVNLVLLNSHLEKLELAIYPNKTITKELIEKHLTVTENAFKILDNLILGRKDLAILEYKRICEKRHYLETLALLQKMISNWIELKTDIEVMTLTEIAQKQKKHEYIIKLALQKLNNTSLTELVNIKKNLIKAEEAIKTDFSLEQELEIEKALLSDF